jgi:hypothetical protein
MGLDACVYCDCYEKGRLRTPPPGGVSLYVAPYGALECDGEHMPFDAVLAFDQWQAFSACEHERGVLLHHRLGNISLVALLRSELQREPSRFPILLTKVVYSGTHGGDYLTIETIPPLQRELEALTDFKCTTREADEFMAQFRVQMSELATTAISVAKPIAF